MHHYLFQLAYTGEAWEKLIQAPQNRVEAVRPAIQKMGGDIAASWMTPGDREYDLIVIIRLPDEIVAAAVLMAFRAGGAIREGKYTHLLSWEDGMKAMAQASGSEYLPPA